MLTPVGGAGPAHVSGLPPQGRTCASGAGLEGRMGVLTKATVRVTALPAHEEFHAVFFPDWERAREAAVQALAQAKLPLSMLRLSNPLETQTTLAMAGHARLIGAMQTYLRWRGCQGQTCVLLLGASGDPAGASCTLRSARIVGRGTEAAWPWGRPWAANGKQTGFGRLPAQQALWSLGYAIELRSRRPATGAASRP